MKIAGTIARYLLGFIFFVFGMNGFLHFIPQPPPASAFAAQYMTVLSASHYFAPIFLIQAVAGLLLLLNRYVPLALALLAPVLVNILMFHSLMDQKGLGLGIFVALLWLVLFLTVRPAFRGIFQATPVSAAV